MQSGISIIICTYNGVQRLKPTLEHISKQKLIGLLNVELLLVDNASTDGTAQFVAEQWKVLQEPFPLRVICEPTPGKINALNTGLAQAKYKYVLTCDDDNSLFDDYLSNGCKILTGNPQIGALGGRGIAVSTVPIPDWFHEIAYMYACAPQGTKTGDVQPQRNVVYGAGMFLNMEAYRQAKAAGFVSLLPSRIGKSLVTGAEDGEICWWLRLAGYEIWYAENLQFYHHLPAGRLTEEYRKRLVATMKIGFHVGKLYARVYRGELTKPIKLFWLKEAAYTLLYMCQIPFNATQNKRYDLKRSWSQLLYLFTQRSKYDAVLNNLLKAKQQLKNV